MEVLNYRNDAEMKLKYIISGIENLHYHKGAEDSSFADYNIVKELYELMNFFKMISEKISDTSESLKKCAYLIMEKRERMETMN
ncbi:MAG: hypothetical protein V1860_02100 [bacterium]